MPGQHSHRRAEAFVSDANPSGFRLIDQRRRHPVIFWVSVLVSVYFLILVSGCAWQRKLLYFPARYELKQELEYAAQNGFVPWRNAEGGVVGWKFPAATQSVGSVLVVHGNGGAALNRRYLAQGIHEAAALDVYVLEYPGYGARPGSPSLKAWLAAGREALSLLPTNQPVYVVSESLGTGVAAHLAERFPGQISGMACFVPYDSLPSLAQYRMPLLLPKLFLVDRYEPAKWLTLYRGPVQFVIAGADDIIPPQFGQRLHDGYGGPKRLLVVPGAGHNEVAEQSAEWWSAVIQFWREHQSGRSLLQR